MPSGSRGKRGASATISGLRVKRRGKNTGGIVAIRVGVAGRVTPPPTPGKVFATRSRTPDGPRDPRGAQDPRDGETRLRGPGAGAGGTLRCGSLQPSAGREAGGARCKVGYLHCFFFILFFFPTQCRRGSPKPPGLLPPRGWAAREPPVTVSQAGDGHLGS